MTKQHYEHLVTGLRAVIRYSDWDDMRQFERRNWAKGFGGAVCACVATLKYDNPKFSRERFVDELLKNINITGVEDLRNEILR